MTQAYATITTFPWAMESTTSVGIVKTSGFFQMKLGTFKALFPQGLGDANQADPFTTHEQEALTYTRHLYPGGPTVEVKRKKKTVKRTRSHKQSTAKSDRKLTLSMRSALGNSQDVIHYTGPTYGAVSWLKKNVINIDNGTIQIHGPNGQSYNAIDPTPES